MSKKFRWSPRTPDTKRVEHVPGKQSKGMDAFDLEAMRDSFAVNRMNGHRTKGREVKRMVVEAVS